MRRLTPLWTLLVLCLLFLITLWLCDSSPVSASAAWWNRTNQLYPPGVLDAFDNWDQRDAAAYCSKTKGRSLTFSHSQAFPLAGVSFLVLVSGRDEARFDAQSFRLSLSKLKDGRYQTLTAGIFPSQVKIIQREGNLDPTFEVFFPLPWSNVNDQVSADIFFDGTPTYKAVLECLTDETNFYRVWESKGLPTGEALYYNSIITAEEPYYWSGQKILFTLWRPRGSSVYPSPGPTPPEPPPTPPPPPKFHPVVLIHGMGGRPENWADEARNMNYQKYLQDLGYPSDYIHLYSYGYKDGQYNYQGDIREIAANLEPVMVQLSKLHKSQGGDGRVDLVGHSLGTLVARYYLNTHKNNHSVRKFIAVGAPFKGSWIMDFDQGLKEIPGVGGYIENNFAKNVSGILIKANILSSDQPVSADSAAAKQVVSDSQFLTELNDPSKASSDVKAYSMYGDINLTLEQRIFGASIKNKYSIGDGVVLPESATYLPGYSSQNLAFSESSTKTIELTRTAEAGFKIKIPGIESLKLFHNFMLGDNNIRSSIKDTLSSN